MADPELRPGEVVLFPSCTPAWAAGTHQLDVVQTVTAGGELLLTADRDNRFTIEVAGGAEPLGPTDVLAAYPAPGSRDASRLMLPHLALRRRTLPWELTVPETAAPWLTVLLLRGGEIGEVVPPAAGGLATLRVATAVLRQVLPAKAELALTCHVRRVARGERLLGDDDDGYVAIAIGNRLPREPGAWTAFAVGLHQAWDQPIWPGTSGGTTVELPVLHAWSFEVGDGGDFEQLCARLRADAAGFGPAHRDDVDLRYEQRDGSATTARYRSPLTDAPATITDASAVAASFSGQAMFELGRLLALADGGALAQLQALRDQAWEEVWFKTIDTQFTAPGGGPVGGFPGLTDELQARLAGVIANLKTGWLERLRGGGSHGGLDDLLRGVSIGGLPGGGRGPIDGDLLARIRARIGGGVTDPVRGGFRPGDAVAQPGPGGVVAQPGLGGVARPSSPAASPAATTPAAPTMDARITSFFERLRTAPATISILERLRVAVTPRRGGGGT